MALPSILARLNADNRRMVVKLVVITLAMFGFGYALVPMYRTICDALGINVLSLSERVTSGAGGISRKASTQVDLSRTVTIEFDANSRGPWEFAPGCTCNDRTAGDRKSTRLNSSHLRLSRMPSSA